MSVLLRDELVSVLGYGGYCIPHLSAAPSSAESVEGRSTSALEDQTALFERHIHEKQSLQGRILSLEQQLEIGQSLISTARSAGPFGGQRLVAAESARDHASSTSAAHHAEIQALRHEVKARDSMPSAFAIVCFSRRGL